MGQAAPIGTHRRARRRLPTAQPGPRTDRPATQRRPLQPPDHQPLRGSKPRVPVPGLCIFQGCPFTF